MRKENCFIIITVTIFAVSSFVFADKVLAMSIFDLLGGGSSNTSSTGGSFCEMISNFPDVGSMPNVGETPVDSETPTKEMPQRKTKEQVRNLQDNKKNRLYSKLSKLANNEQQQEAVTIFQDKFEKFLAEYRKKYDEIVGEVELEFEEPSSLADAGQDNMNQTQKIVREMKEACQKEDADETALMQEFVSAMQEIRNEMSAAGEQTDSTAVSENKKNSAGSLLQYLSEEQKISLQQAQAEFRAQVMSAKEELIAVF